MKWCERCGGPLRDELKHPTEDWDHWSEDGGACRGCGLGFWMSQEVMDDSVSRSRPDSPYRHQLAFIWRPQRAEAHSPCPHASGWWLPEGAREALRTTIDYDAEGVLAWPDDDEIALEKWHRERYV